MKYLLTDISRIQIQEFIGFNNAVSVFNETIFAENNTKKKKNGFKIVQIYTIQEVVPKQDEVTLYLEEEMSVR